MEFNILYNTVTVNDKKNYLILIFWRGNQLFFFLKQGFARTKEMEFGCSFSPARVNPITPNVAMNSSRARNKMFTVGGTRESSYHQPF